MDKAASVENFDVMHKAYEAAKARIADLANDMGDTLVDTIPATQWVAWDASQEKALVCDSADLDYEGEDGDTVPQAA